MPSIHEWTEDDGSSSDDSASTVSTNFTADNLPGAGRTVGLAYDFLGRHVEAVANDFGERHGLKPRKRTASIASISTNETADDLAGPGRIVGLLIGAIGRRIESAINKIAVVGGMGPDAAYLRIMREYIVTVGRAETTRMFWRDHEVVTLSPDSWTEKATSLMIKNCQKLLKHAQYVKIYRAG